MVPTKKIPRIPLAPDYSISKILKGGWQLAGGHGPINKQTAIDDMFKFAESGVTTFDFGDIYTGVEELIGEFLKQYSKKFGPKKLKDIQTHTKFVPDLEILDNLTIFHVGFGFLFWSAGLVLGTVQAYQVWNRLPLLDPKILGSFLVLIIYALFFIFRWALGMRGKKTMTLVMVGYFLALFTFLGVRFFLTTQHVF